MRVVTATDSERPENEKARIMLEKALAKSPTNLVFLYEEPNGNVVSEALSGSVSAARGLVEYAYESFFPVGGE
jgi:hypothetical protein